MRRTSQNVTPPTGRKGCSFISWLGKVTFIVALLAMETILGLGAGVINAQNVTGTVISGSDNEPLIGASIIVQGTKAGAVTDLDGNFSIQAKQGQTLTVSYLGYITQNVKVKDGGGEA